MSECRPVNLYKELEKIQQKDTMTLEANNPMLVAQVADLEVAIAKKDKELQQLQV